MGDDRDLGDQIVARLERWKWEPERHQRVAKLTTGALGLPVVHRARLIQNILAASRGQGLEALLGIPEHDTPLKAEAVARVKRAIAEWKDLRPAPRPQKRELAKLKPRDRERRIEARVRFKDRWELDLAERLLEDLELINPEFREPAVRAKLRPRAVREIMRARGKRGAPWLLAEICKTADDALGHWAHLDQQAFAQAVKDHRGAEKKRNR